MESEQPAVEQPATNKGFWDGWQLWMKLCFILFCSIGVTVVFGITMRLKRRRRRRRATKLKEQQKADNESAINEKEQQKVLNMVPFGIRALEFGVEVKGIWTSWPHTTTITPEASTPTTLLPSPALNGSCMLPQFDGTHPSPPSPSVRSSSSTISHLEIPQPAHTRAGDHSNARRTKIDCEEPSPSQKELTDSGSLDCTSSMRGRPAYQPHGCRQAKAPALGGSGAQRKSGVSMGSNGSEYEWNRGRGSESVEMITLDLRSPHWPPTLDRHYLRSEARDSIESLPFTTGLEES